MGITPKAKGDEEKLAVGLSTLHEEDPTFVYHVDSELHQTVISGQGELHLQVSIQRLQRRFNLNVNTFKPRIPFRETIRGKGKSSIDIRNNLEAQDNLQKFGCELNPKNGAKE